MEIWYALTSQVNQREVQDSIREINEQLYSRPVQYLRFLIASAGAGEIAAGINMYMYLKAFPVEVETIAFGEIDVAATMIFLGGAKRTVVRGCQFFFREGQYTIQDPTAPVHVHEEVISVFRREHQEMIYIIAHETGNDTEVVAHMLRRSKIMQTDEAKDFGLSHQAIDRLPLFQQESVGFKSALHSDEKDAK